MYTNTWSNNPHKYFYSTMVNRRILGKYRFSIEMLDHWFAISSCFKWTFTSFHFILFHLSECDRREWSAAFIDALQLDIVFLRQISGTFDQHLIYLLIDWLEHSVQRRLLLSVPSIQKFNSCWYVCTAALINIWRTFRCFVNGHSAHSA